MVYLCGYDAITGLVAGVWVFPLGSTVASAPSGLSGASAWEDVTSLYGTPACPGPGWTRTGPLSYMAPAPIIVSDPNGFVAAVVASGIAGLVKLAATANLAALTIAIEQGNVAQITAMWDLLVATYSISSDDQATIASLATTYNIPGIS